MPEIEVAEYSDLIQLARSGCAIIPFDGDMPQPNSQDSYNYFVRFNRYVYFSREELTNRAIKRWRNSLAGKQQAEWEEWIRQRQENREEISSREWALEIERRKKDAHD